MPCPYAERRGPVIYCKAIGKAVSPLTHPCLSKDRYKKCKYYRAAESKKKPVEKPAEPATREASPPRPVEPPRIEARAESTAETGKPPAQLQAPAAGKGGAPKTLGITLDGKPARTCLECIYYGSRTKVCLLLGIEVKDPFNPPCAES